MYFQYVRFEFRLDVLFFLYKRLIVSYTMGHWYSVGFCLHLQSVEILTGQFSTAFCASSKFMEPIFYRRFRIDSAMSTCYDWNVFALGKSSRKLRMDKSNQCSGWLLHRSNVT